MLPHWLAVVTAPDFLVRVLWAGNSLRNQASLLDIEPAGDSG